MLQLGLQRFRLSRNLQSGMGAGFALFLSTSAASIGTSNVSKKGSFLLKSTGKESEAASVVDKSKTERNAVIGRELINLRDKQLGPNVSVFYKQDGGLVITKGKGVHMIDVDGNYHLDCCNSKLS